MFRVPVADLLDPANRGVVEHGRTGPGVRTPAFEVGGLLVWGFTAMLLHQTFEIAGLAKPWDTSVRRPIPRDMRPSTLAMLRNRLRRRR